MANNPYANRVDYAGDTLIDLTSDTVDAAHLASGYTAHAASGAPIVGAMNVGEDYVTYVGTYGNSPQWTCRKWNSGIAECWCRASKNITSWSTWGSLYEANPAIQVSYPSNWFIEPPMLFVSNNNGGAGLCGIEMYNAGTKDQTPSMYLLRPNSGNVGTYYVDIYAIGKWK